MSRLSAERVAGELIRLLSVPDPLPALRMMGEDGVLAAVLPEATRLDRLARLIPLEPQIDPLRRLAALVAADADGAAAMAERLRLANAQRERIAGLMPPWPLDPHGDSRATRQALYRLGAERCRDLALLLAAEGALERSRLAEFLALAAVWRSPLFPLTGHDVAALGVMPGPATGDLLAAVRAWWASGDFAADRRACLKKLRELAGRRDAAL